MKKIIVTLFVFMLTQLMYSQQDTVWRRGGLFALNFTQVSLTNWAAGGQNSISGNSIINCFANYKRGKYVWDNSIDLGYGLNSQGKKGNLIKSDDKIELNSKYGRKALKNVYYSTLVNFRSQFTSGYNYPNDSLVISKFLAPAYVTVALGMDYKPKDYFSLFISPATARFIFVNDKLLSAAGSFGVDSGKTLRTEIGAYARITFKKDISSNFNFQTTLDLFSNYIENPQNIDVNWQMLCVFKISKFISASLSTHLLYDDNTKLTFYKSDGITVDRVGPDTQFKEVIGIGFAYKFSGVTNFH